MPDRENHIFKKGLDFAELGQYTEALACFDQAVALNPDDASAWNNRGIILGELGRYSEALACFDKAVALNPDDPAAMEQPGYCAG